MEVVRVPEPLMRESCLVTVEGRHFGQSSIAARRTGHWGEKLPRRFHVQVSEERPDALGIHAEIASAYAAD
jgi:hypothetical protein